MKPITITITRPDTAAYIGALLLNCKPGQQHCLQSAKERVDDHFPGGWKAAEKLSEECYDFQEERYQAWVKIEDGLQEEGINKTNAPWLKIGPPLKIGGCEVEYSSEGVKLGYANVSLEEMKLMIKKCEEK